MLLMRWSKREKGTMEIWKSYKRANGVEKREILYIHPLLLVPLVRYLQ